MCRPALDSYGWRPTWLDAYISYRGWHFDKNSCDFAVSLMKRVNPSTGRKEKIDPMSKESVDALLNKYGIKLENNVGYDYVYVANMCKADFLKSSVPDEQHHAMYIRDVIDDADASDGEIMREWWAKMVARGEFVPWDEWL